MDIEEDEDVGGLGEIIRQERAEAEVEVREQKKEEAESEEKMTYINNDFNPPEFYSETNSPGEDEEEY